jgi:hypothetical protein
MAYRYVVSGGRNTLTILHIDFTPVQVLDALGLHIGTVTLAGPSQRHVKASLEDLGLIVEFN